MAIFDETRRQWRDLAGATIGLACGVGMYTPITSMFFRAIETEFGWSKTATAAGLVALPITGLALPFAGRLIDRFGVRVVAGMSALAMASCFLLLSLIGDSLAAFYAGFLGFNVLGCATGPVSYTRPIARSFLAARGTAIAIGLSGISISGIVLAPVLGPMLAHGGWRRGYQLLAIVALLGGLLAIWLIRPVARTASATPTEGLLRREAIRTSAFWQLGAAVFIAGAGSVGFVSQLQSVALEHGVPLATTGGLLAVLALSVLVFRILSGRLLDLAKPERAAAGFFFASALGLCLWLLPHGSTAAALGGTIALGLSVGSEHAFISFFCARLFGLRAYSANFGALAIFLYFGMAVGGLYFAVSHDILGSYAFAITSSVVALFLASALMMTLSQPAVPTSADGRKL